MKERNAHLSFLFTGFLEAAAVQQRLTVSVALVKSNLPALKVRQYKIRVKLRRKKKVRGHFCIFWHQVRQKLSQAEF